MGSIGRVNLGTSYILSPSQIVAASTEYSFFMNRMQNTFKLRQKLRRDLTINAEYHNHLLSPFDVEKRNLASHLG